MIAAQDLMRALAHAVEHAQNRAHQSLALARDLMAQVACGQAKQAAPATRALHMAAFETMSFAQLAAFNARATPEQAKLIFDCAVAGQDRALELEQLERKQRLAPAQMYFDDVLPVTAIELAAPLNPAAKAAGPAPRNT